MTCRRQNRGVDFCEILGSGDDINLTTIHLHCIETDLLGICHDIICVLCRRSVNEHCVLVLYNFERCFPERE